MESLWGWGNDLIVALQTAAGLEPIMQFASFLGTEEFFLLLMPALLWAWNERLGRRLAVLLIVSNGLGNILKVIASHPRPYWIDARIKALSVETSYGLPSTHAQVGLVVWGFLAQQATPARRTLAWIIAGTVIFMISFSRLFLGMHFPTDVLGGWVIGIATLWAFLRLEAPAAAWLGRLSLGAQIGLSFGVSVLFLAVALGAIAARGDIPELAEWTTNAAAAYPLDLEVEPISPRSPDSPVNTAGMLFGLGAGLACSARWARFNAGGPWLKRGARYVIGLVGVLLFWRGLALIFPTDPLAVGIAFRYVRYALVVFWAVFGAPWVFLRLGLAEHRDNLR
jgi:membrane-associated phospholipid phosphatase